MTRDRSPIAWNELKAIIDRHQRFVLTSHVRPDCDALGSELAMAEVLEHLGKEVRIVNADAVPPRLAFVDPQHRIEVLPEDATEPPGTAVDVIMVLDTGAWGQLGRMADVIRRTRRRGRGHRPSRERRRDPERGGLPGRAAEATGRLVADFVQFLGMPGASPWPRRCSPAIATDTGWFRFSSTREQHVRGGRAS